MNAGKMADMPVKKLLLNMGIPMMISMLGQALYNVVDTYFVSYIPDTAQVTNMGDKAINALTLAFPVQLIIVALGVGTGVGINAMVARNLGRNDKERAARTAGNALFMAVCYFAVMALFGIFAAKNFIGSQTKDPVIAQMGTDYLRIVTVFSFGALGYMTMEKIVMATGKTMITMICQLTGAVTNIILDPILIRGMFGMPAMGVSGAAWATVLGQILSLVIISVFYFKRGVGIDRGIRYLKPEKSVLKDIYTVGFPAIIMQILTPVMTYVMNLILGTISVSAVTAYGVYYKLQSFIFMPGFGLNNALIPIVSFNYGAGKKERIREAIRWGLVYVSIIMGAGIILFQLGAGAMVGIFSIAEESTRLCITALRIISCGFFFAGGNIILQGVCQALGKGSYSLLISLLRFIILTLPLAWLFAALPSAGTVVWLALPIAEAGACLTAVGLMKHVLKKRNI